MSGTKMISQAISDSVPGVSDRQIHFWIQQGYLLPGQPPPGSGRTHDWPDSEVCVAQMMARLVVAGFVPAAAAEHARWLCQRPLPTRMMLPGGLVLEVGDAP